MADYKGTITLASVFDAIQYYTWIAYSNGAALNPSVTSTPQTDTKQIGFAYNKTSSTASNIYSDYTWSDYIGTSGVGVSNIIEQYYLSTSNITQTGGTWTTTPEPWSANHYYWTRSEITWTDSTITYTDPVLAVDLNQINQNLVNLQNQVDGQIQTWYYEGTPTLNNAPANTWTSTTDKDKHIGDLYYDKSTGYAYRFMYDNTTSTYVWTKITDSDVTEALQLAESKSTVWVIQPTVPYYAGDLWVVTNQDGSKTVYSCTQNRTTGSFSSGDWVITATDNALAEYVQSTSVTQIDVQYAKNQDPENAPTTGWSTTAPEWEDGWYIWTRTITYINNVAGTPTDPVCITGAVGATGAAAPYISLDGPTNIVTVDTNNNNSITPSSNITITATSANLSSSIIWSYKIEGVTASRPSYITENTNNVVVNTSNFVAADKNTITIIATGDGVSDSYTITRLKSGQNGTNGVSITNTTQTITYGNSANASTQPSSWSNNPSPEEGKYLWTKTVVTYTYSNNTTSQTTSYSIAYIGTDGQNGNDGRGISSTVIEYAKSSSGDTAPSSGWVSTINATNIEDGYYLWTRTTINYTSGNPSVTYSVSYWAEDGAPGATGAHGINTATINLYKRGASAPAKPTGSATYTFSTKTITTTNLNGWSQTIPTGTDILWMIAATATSDTDTDDIASTEWSTQVQLQGIDGNAGTDGYNQATVYIYRRSNTAITTAPSSVTYTFADGSFTVPTNWSKTIPSGTDPCYVCSGVAISQSATTTITWSTPTKLVEDGAPGADAVEIILSNESHTLTANSAGVATIDANAYTNIQVFEGSVDKTTDYTIKVNNATSGSQTINNITVTINNTLNPRKVTVTAVADNFTSNVVPIDIYKGSTKLSTKQFTIAVSKAGATGNGIASVTITYGYSNDPDDPISVPSSGEGSWQSTVPAVPNGYYLWTKTEIAYTDTSLPHTISYNVSYFGENGADGDLYRVESSYDFIYSVLDENSSTIDTPIFTFSPDTLYFKVYKGESTVAATPGSSNGGSVVQEGNYLIFDSGSPLTPGDSNTAGDYYYSFDFLGVNTINTKTNIETYNTYGTVAEIDANNNTQVNFYMSGIQANGAGTNTGDQSRPLYNVYKACIDGNAFFTFNVYSDVAKQHILTKYVFYVQNLTSTNLASLASFKQTATSIEANVRSAGLDFTATGLSIYNGDFSIYTISKDDPLYNPTTIDTYKVLKFDHTTGNLYINGNGIFGGRIEANEGWFSGELRAATGNFSGKISAIEGDIGGIQIGTNSIYSNNGAFSINDDGSIIANDITLGGNINLNTYIKLGTNSGTTYNASYLFNSDWIANPANSVSDDPVIDNKPYFFTVNNKNVYLTADGLLKLGHIQINGQTSVISGTTRDDEVGSEWKDFEITPTHAFFHNIDVGSGKISAAVFEVDHTQAVGGSMLFKPSYKIESYTKSGTNIIFHLSEAPVSSIDDTISYLDANQYVIIVGADGTHLTRDTQSTTVPTYPVASVNGKDVTINNLTIDTEFTPASLIILGAENDIIIGINSTDSHNLYMQPRGLTITKFLPAQKENNSVPNLFLGDFSRTNLNSDIYQGFGLYAENVYLTGSLTTLVENNSYAGVNTLNGATANKFGTSANDDTSKIVFWAGSDGISTSDIQGAKFQVTQAGSLYAQKGLFEGALITNSRIEGADIYAARIHGTGRTNSEDTTPGLSFYDLNNSIAFYKTNENVSTQVFHMGIDGLAYYTTNDIEQYFIEVTNNGVIFSGQQVNSAIIEATTYIGTSILRVNEWYEDPETHEYILDNKLLIGEVTNNHYNAHIIKYLDKESNILSYLDLYGQDVNNNKIISLSIENEGAPQLTMSSNHADFYVDELSLQKNLHLGNTERGQGYMLFQQSLSNVNDKGYDLYI